MISYTECFTHVFVIVVNVSHCDLSLFLYLHPSIPHIQINPVTLVFPESFPVCASAPDLLSELFTANVFSLPMTFFDGLPMIIKNAFFQASPATPTPPVHTSMPRLLVTTSGGKLLIVAAAAALLLPMVVFIWYAKQIGWLR